ncbi:Survival factor 1 [Fusarium oxysporum f. sp. albedinis]|nr:Survival factor 1 [Fusarium oxysporum f. sp. albedinis]
MSIRLITSTKVMLYSGEPRSALTTTQALNDRETHWVNSKVFQGLRLQARCLCESFSFRFICPNFRSSETKRS